MRDGMEKPASVKKESGPQLIPCVFIAGDNLCLDTRDTTLDVWLLDEIQTYE